MVYFGSICAQWKLCPVGLKLDIVIPTEFPQTLNFPISLTVRGLSQAITKSWRNFYLQMHKDAQIWIFCDLELICEGHDAHIQLSQVLTDILVGKNVTTLLTYLISKKGLSKIPGFQLIPFANPLVWTRPLCLLKTQKQWGVAAAAAAKSLQSCPTLCDPIDGSPPGFPVPGILQARTLEWVAISFSNAWEWKLKVKSLSLVRLFSTPWTTAYQAPPSMGFSRQKYWSGVPLPSRSKVLIPAKYWNGLKQSEKLIS